MLLPDIRTPSNTLAVTEDTIAHTFTVNPGQTFVVGNALLATSDFTTAALRFGLSPNRAMHLRFSLNGGFMGGYPTTKLMFYLVDVANVQYNNSSLLQDNIIFRQDPYDMLVAYVVTDAAARLTYLPVRNRRSQMSADVITPGTGDVTAGDLQNAVAQLDAEIHHHNHVRADVTDFTSHDHDSRYSMLGHNHIGVYAPTSHTQDITTITATDLDNGQQFTLEVHGGLIQLVPVI